MGTHKGSYNVLTSFRKRAGCPQIATIQAATYAAASPDGDTVSVPHSTDTFVIRDDKIVRQTGWFKVVPK